MKKRIVSFLLALVMAVSLLPVSAFAVDVDVPTAQGVPAVKQQNDENTTPDTAIQPDPTNDAALGEEGTEAVDTPQEGYKIYGARTSARSTR